MLISLFLLAFGASAQQDVKLVNPDTFCKIESFSAPKGQSTKAFVKCDALKDKTEVATKSMAECKERALSKGDECRKVSGADELSIKGKYIERFAVSFNSTSFNCAISKAAGKACP